MASPFGLDNTYEQSRKLFKYTQKECKEIKTVKHRLECPDCFSMICANDISHVEGFNFFSQDLAFAGEKFWKGVSQEIIDSLTPYEFKMVCNNPGAVEYVKANRQKIGKAELIVLFGNSAALDLVIELIHELKLDGKTVVDCGGKHARLCPYFDMTYVRDILCGRESKMKKFYNDTDYMRNHYSLFEELMENIALTDIFRECFPEIVKHHQVEYEFMPKFPHLLPVVYEFIDHFKSEKCLARLNVNASAVEFIVKNPSLIVWPMFARNRKAMKHIESFLLLARSDIDQNYLDTMNAYNKNPLAVPFLQKHPHMITDDILENPNIWVKTDVAKPDTEEAKTVLLGLDKIDICEMI